MISFQCAWVDVQKWLRFVEGRGRGSHTSVCGRRWVWSGKARDHYASEISDRKCRTGKDPVIAHMKARSKHSLLTETALDLKLH